MSKSWRTALIVGALIAVFAATSAGATKFITGGDIKNGTIGLKDLSKAARNALKGKTGPAGAAGPQGPAGPAGAQGPAGPSSLSTTLRSADFTAPVHGTASGEVRCPDGMVAVGGSVSPQALYTAIDQPSTDGHGWVGAADDLDGTGGREHVVVICTTGSATVLPNGS
ncbi:MAG: hypothetical protein ACTHOE_13095 [Conexibacter sp.]